MLSYLAAIPALLLILIVLWDVFESMVLPRRVQRRLRFARYFYRVTWGAYTSVVRRVSDAGRRESLLGFYGPLSIIMLLVVWAGLLVLAFGLLQWSCGSQLLLDGRKTNFGNDVYMSGTTFFTLGLGDIRPDSALARAITVVEAGTGFGFLALVIGYLPVLYQTFSRREITISLLDARAGSPPTAGEMLRRHTLADGTQQLDRLLLDWERWAGDLLESHLSYPILAYFRSQHDRQSWLMALTAILDVCALILAAEPTEAAPLHPARLAFAISRHAAVDLSQVFGRQAVTPIRNRLSARDLDALNPLLVGAGFRAVDSNDARTRLTALRDLYEPYVSALASMMLIELPDTMPSEERADDWQTTDANADH